ncbi:hypothetical protein SDC9_137250 [bioreactor metagenome]|uniref:Uncharacterized protein n=1 Tax=bioreactor metagenome TaxID=1076179 RepID=A0A645DMW5_9ZZZZ
MLEGEHQTPAELVLAGKVVDAPAIAEGVHILVVALQWIRILVKIHCCCKGCTPCKPQR